MTLLFFCLFAFSVAFSFVATRQIRDIANRRGWVCQPQDSRHVHETPLPRLGGVAIFLAFTITLGLWLVLSLRSPHLVSGTTLPTLLRIYFPACLIFALGIYDDLRGASP